MSKHEWTPLIDTPDVRSLLWLKPEDDVRNFQGCEKTNTIRADFYRPNGLSPQRRTYRGGKLTIGAVPAREQPQPIPAYTKINPIDHPVGTRIVYGKYHWHLLQEATVVEWSSDGELVAIKRAVSEVPEWKHVSNREMRVWAVVEKKEVSANDQFQHAAKTQQKEN